MSGARTLTPTTPSRFRRWAPRVGIAFLVWIILAGLASRLVPNVPVAGVRTGAADGFVVGAVHMHTTESDGGGTVDDLVDAALANGLDFIVVTDHNIERRSSFEYRRDVLILYGEELTLPNMGHAMLLDVDTVRLMEPDSVDRARALPFHRTLADAGLRVAAHPNGRRYWWDRTMGAVDAMEIWNADSEWRNDGVIDWLEALTLLPFRPELGMMALVDRPDRNLALLDSVSLARRISTTCAVDAHAAIKITDGWIIRFPTYRMTLGLLQQHVPISEPMTGDADRDGRMLTNELRNGGGYCALGGMADDGGVRIDVEDDEVVVLLPDDLPQARIRVYRDGDLLMEQEGTSARIESRSTSARDSSAPDGSPGSSPAPFRSELVLTTLPRRSGAPSKTTTAIDSRSPILSGFTSLRPATRSFSGEQPSASQWRETARPMRRTRDSGLGSTGSNSRVLMPWNRGVGASACLRGMRLPSLTLAKPGSPTGVTRERDAVAFPSRV
jgi:hypothetical protein